MIVFAFFLPFSVKSGCVTLLQKGLHISKWHILLYKIKDIMKRNIITDQVNVFFFPFQRIITIIIIVMLCHYRRTSQNPLDDCKRVQHLVDTRSLRFGKKTVKDIRSFIITLIRKKSQRQQRLSRYRQLDPKAWLCYMSL